MPPNTPIAVIQKKSFPLWIGEKPPTKNTTKKDPIKEKIVEYRFNQLQELEAILEFLNIEQRRKKTKYYKKYLEGYNKALSSRDAEKYADGEDDVVDQQHIVNEFALIRNKFIGQFI